ncbi:MAG: hypothetical protein H6773_00905 [Pseudomonadales bacterium]|nr:hypothetical protein [Candidatus Woesebacteria bacterium]MCB9800716.1 hypothetical protein [Pseudomonadales bacterium]
MSEYYLAVDGGGTKTDVMCVDETGAVIGTGSSGPTSLTVSAIGAASFNLIEAVRVAIESKPEIRQFKKVVFGLAGVDTVEERDRAEEIFRRALSHYQFEEFILLNDSEIALVNGSDSPNALILVSGTGSICYGKNSQGQTARVSGMDYLLADQGSGYSIGRKVLHAAVKSFDGRGQKTSLEGLVCEHFMVPKVSYLKQEVYNPDLTKSEVARLSRLCTKAAIAGDEVAQKILDEEIQEMVLSVATVLNRLHSREEEFDIVFAGAILELETIASRVREQLSAQFSHLNFVRQEKDPVCGAVKLALQK